MTERSIKFRIWDKKNKLWIKPQFNGSVLVGDDMIAISHNQPDNHGGYTAQTPVLLTWGEMGNLEVNQFTGMKDKNGKRIYEGDVVRVDHRDPRYKPSNHEIKWDPENCDYDIGCGTISEVHWSHEVIGNVYENPDLLTK